MTKTKCCLLKKFQNYQCSGVRKWIITSRNVVTLTSGIGMTLPTILHDVMWALVNQRRRDTWGFHGTLRHVGNEHLFRLSKVRRAEL